MKDVIKSAVDYKIIPENYENSASIKLIDVNDQKAVFKLKKELDSYDYEKDSNVEIFGVNELGMLYFESKVISYNNDILEVEIPENYSIIQRRAYSRVGFGSNKIKFLDLAENTVSEVLDISAGGLKFISNYELNVDKVYNIQFALGANMLINCQFQPIRCTKNEENKYVVSGSFKELDNVDRIAIIQYAFKVKMEGSGKEG